MKTQKQWIEEIAEAGELHKLDCICDRCKNGRETFLLPSDVGKIQQDALLAAAAVCNELKETAGSLRITSKRQMAELCEREIMALVYPPNKQIT